MSDDWECLVCHDKVQGWQGACPRCRTSRVIILPMVEVTREMRSAFRANCPTGPHTVDDETLGRGYRAMHAAAPVPLVTETEDALHYAKAEALRWRTENTRLHDLVKVLTDARDQRQADAKAWAARFAEKSAECNKLRAQLAELLPHAPPVLNPFRAFNHDRRRVGG